MGARVAGGLVVSCLVLSAGGASGASSGTWPTFAHDFSRSGRADGVADMHNPQVAWTKEMGGSLGAGQALVIDLDGDGRPNVVTITGGRVLASKPDGTSLWKGALSGPRAILGVWPLSGATPEVVVDTPTGVQILSGVDGHLLTTLVMGAPSSAAFAPEGGDASTGGILVLATSRGPVSGFDFRSGTGVTTPLWTTTSDNQTTYLVGDVDGDGVPDLVHPLDAGMEVDDPITGHSKYSLAAMGPAAFFYLYELANVDGVPGDEIVVFDTSYQYSPQTGVYVLGVRGGVLTTLWSDAVAATNALDADTFSVAGSVVDLDDDGSLELVYSRWSAGTLTWTTQIADAATGTQLATLPGQFLQALPDLDGNGKHEIVVRDGVTATQTPPRSTLTAYDFASRQAGAVARTWSVPRGRVLALDSTTRQGPSIGLGIPVTAPFISTSDANELLVAEDMTGHGDDTQYGILSGSNGNVAPAVPVTATIDPTALGWADGLTSTTSKNDLVLFTTDGTVHIEPSTLASDLTFPSGTFSYWSYVNAGPNGNNLLFGTTSNNHLLWLDPTRLHADGTPYVVFDEPSIFQSPALASGGYPLDPVVLLAGSSPTFVSFETTQTASSTTVTIVAHDPTGIELWRTPLPSGAQVYPPGSYAVDLTNDGFPDLVVAVFSSSSVESLVVYDGTTGQLVRSTPVASILPGSDVLTTGALVDVNGDGVLDLVAPEHTHGVLATDLTQNPMSELWLISRSGSVPVNGTVGTGQLDPADSGLGSTLFRVNGGNGFGPYERYALDGGVLASVSEGFSTANAFDENSVALVQRSGTGAYDLVSAGTASVGLSRVRRIAGDTLSTVWTEYAANGSISTSAPTQGFALHNPLEVDVNNDGIDDIVFGSDDGYVYAVRSSDGALVFSVNLGAQVEFVIAANIDLDPQLELVAGLADGRLVALDDNYSATMDVDGGTPDGGNEAGADAAPDATLSGDAALDAANDGPSDGTAPDDALDSGEGGAGATPPSGSSGCGCKAAGTNQANTSTFLGCVSVLVAMALGRRRRAQRALPRRSQRSHTSS